jgi:hypothetical protein
MVFQRILQSGLFPRLGDSDPTPHRNKRDENVQRKRIHIIRILRQNEVCYRSHSELIDLKSQLVKDRKLMVEAWIEEGSESGGFGGQMRLGLAAVYILGLGGTHISGAA